MSGGVTFQPIGGTPSRAEPRIPLDRAGQIRRRAKGRLHNEEPRGRGPSRPATAKRCHFEVIYRLGEFSRSPWQQWTRRHIGFKNPPGFAGVLASGFVRQRRVTGSLVVGELPFFLPPNTKSATLASVLLRAR
jgi:hypothetical protein